MADQTPDHQPDNTQPKGGRPVAAESPTLRVIASVALGLAAFAVLAYAGGSLNITSDGVAMDVNPRPLS